MADDVIKTLLAEAYGEGPEAMRRVAETILNRAAIRGITPEEVVRQANQYTGLTNPGPEARKTWTNPKAIAAAQAAYELAQQSGDPTNGSDHYHTTAVSPYWANKMPKTGQYGSHLFYASRPVPPGELPYVGTAQSTVPMLRNAPTPVTASIDLAQMRRISAPSQLIPDTFAKLTRSNTAQRSAADIGLTDRNAVTPFLNRDGASITDPAALVFGRDMTTAMPGGTRRPAPPMPMATQQSYAGQESNPRNFAPTPATPSPQLAGRRATDPTLQAALIASYPAQLPSLSAPRTVMTASDRVRGNETQTRNNVTTVASIPTSPQVSASDRVRGNPAQTRNNVTTVASIPTTRPQISASDMARGRAPQFPTTAQITAATGFRAPPAIPDRLMPGAPGLPALYGGNVAGVGTRAVAPMPFQRPSFPTQVAAVPKVAPVPFQRPNLVGTQLSLLPMPPMPIPRPGIGGPFRQAPIPVPMSPGMAVRRAPAPNVLTSFQQAFAGRRPNPHVWMSGFSDSGSSGGAHGGSADDQDNAIQGRR